MAFMSMVLVAAFFIIAILLGIGFIGLIVTIVSVIKRKRTPEGQKKKKAGLIIGIILLSVPVVPVVAILIYSAVDHIQLEMQRKNYTCLTDEWRNEWVSPEDAREDALKTILKAAEEGDAEEIKKLFPQNAQGPALEKQINQFLETYPKGLSELELPELFSKEYSKLSRKGMDSYDEEHYYFSVYFETEMDGERYYVSIEGCNQNDAKPEEVGVVLFTVETEQAYVTKKKYSETDYIYSNMLRDADYEVRKIQGVPYAFTPIKRKLRKKEVIETLRDNYYLDNFVEKFGKPNAARADDDSEEGEDFYELLSEEEEDFYELLPKEGEYFYELLPEQGEARYLKLEVEYYDEICGCYICGEEEDYELELEGIGIPEE